ncbi:MAG: hypothetical protein ACLRXC_10465 [[Clostridium] leptum]
MPSLEEKYNRRILLVRGEAMERREGYDHGKHRKRINEKAYRRGRTNRCIDWGLSQLGFKVDLLQEQVQSRKRAEPAEGR